MVRAVSPTLAKTIQARLAVVRGTESQRELAKATGVPLAVVNRALTGTATPPVRHILALARHYRVSTDWLLGEVDVPRRRKN